MNKWNLGNFDIRQLQTMYIQDVPRTKCSRLFGLRESEECIEKMNG